MVKNWHKMREMAINLKWPKMYQKLPIMFGNVMANGSHEARNTNTKLSDQKW